MNGVSINISSYLTLALSIVVYYFGKYVNSKLPSLNKYCIPNPVIGGVFFAMLNLFLYETNIAKVVMDTSLQSFFMTMFFTSIGFTASLAVLKKGGKEVIKMVLICTVLIILQDIVGVGLSKSFGLQPLLGLCAGSIPLVGGHGTSGAFGPMLESIGIQKATTVAIAFATFGLIMGSLMGGPIARRLIMRDNLTCDDPKDELSDLDQDQALPLEPENFMSGQSHILIAMGLGTLLTKLFIEMGIVIPGYIGSMLIAAIIRNISDSTKKYEVHIPEIQILGTVALNIFLSMAMMTLRIWELFDLAGPLSVMAVVQTIVMALFAYYVVYPGMGKGYEASVMVSAVCGFGMGATPNAMANMSALTSKYGPAPRAFFVVPLVGSLFIDFVNSTVLTAFINVFK
jgi:ESS family glutamate:Na+ symporter